MIRVLSAALAILVCTVAAAEPRYREIQIPTRDGKTLAADFYSTDTSARRPTILVQTPYNRTYYRLTISLPQAGGASIPWDSARYNLVVVDWRGFFGSRDAAVTGYDRGLDGYDAVEWIAAQSWSDGNVGTWGPSALGLIQYQTARHRPPHLRCAVPLVKDFKTKYSDFYEGGEYRREHVETLGALGLTQPALILEHPTRDATWSFVERNSDFAEDISIPMLVVGGWYDHFPSDVIRSFNDLRERSDPTVREKHKLIVGPWLHEGIDEAEAGALTYPDAQGFVADAALRFFDRYLLGIDNGFQEEATVRYYQMGQNAWRHTEGWPDPRLRVTMRPYTLRADSSLDLAPSEGTLHQFRYDPRDPSPTVGGARLAIGLERPPTGPQDQAPVESRADALAYTSPVLTEPLEIDGPVVVHLVVSSDREDTDIALRLCDVHPDGRSMLITQSIQRLRFRRGDRPQDTAALVPGTTSSVSIMLQDLAMTWPAGHRVRLIVTGSNYPQYERNLNTGGPLYGGADTLIATTTLHLGGPVPCYLGLPVVTGVNEAPATRLPLELELTQRVNEE